MRSMFFDDTKGATDAGFAFVMYDIVNDQIVCRVDGEMLIIPSHIRKFSCYIKGHDCKCIKLEDLKPNVTE